MGALLDISPTLFAVPVFLFFVYILEVLQLALALIYCFCDALFIVQSSNNFIPSFPTVLAFQAVDVIGP